MLEPAAVSWKYLAARVAVALGILGYSAVLGAFAALYAVGISAVVLAEDSIPTREVYIILLWCGSLASVAVVGFVCAGLVVFLRRVALPAVLAFAIYAMVGVLPVAFVQVSHMQSPARIAQVIAVGSLASLLFVSAFGALRILRDRELTPSHASPQAPPSRTPPGS